MRIVWIASLLVLFPTMAGADILLLKDGRIIDGKKLTRTEPGIEVAFDNGMVLVPHDLVEDALIEGEEGGFVPRTEEEKEKAEQGLVPFEGRWVKASQRERLLDKKIAAKRAELKEILNRKEWRNRWKETTKHFEFETTVPPVVFTYYRDMMEAYFTEFAKIWKVKQPKELGKLKVCFYTNLKKFGQIGGVGGGVRGYFRFVEPLELNFYYDRVDPRYTEEVMFHEANHYLQMLIDPKFSMPHFPGEAIAEYFGASVYDPSRRKLTVGLIQEGRLTGIKSQVDSGDMLGLKKMLETSQMYEHYSWGWSLVHYLMNDKSYKKKLEKWVLALPRAKDIKRVDSGNGKMSVTGEEVLRSFMKYMGIKDEEALAELETEWHEYVKEKLDVVSARGLSKAAQGALSTGRRNRAARLFKEAIEAGDTSPSTYHEYAQILRRDGKNEEAIAYLKKAIEFDPLLGQLYATLAEALMAVEKPDEAKQMARLSLELDPGDMWVEFAMKELLAE